MHPFQLRFSLLFCTFFETFREKPKKGSRVRPQGHKNMSKWTSRTQKRRPRINKLSPKVPPSTKNMQKKSPRVAKWSPKRYNGVAGPPKVQEKHKKVSQSANKTRRVLQGAEKHTSTHRHQQPTNQRNKGRHESANKQTNEQTPP